MGFSSRLRELAALVVSVLAIASGPGPARAEAAGRIDAPGLSVSKESNGEITLGWPGSCLASDTDFEVYEGALDDPAGLAPVACTTGGTTMFTVDPGPGQRFFLVVPRNATREGSYGRHGPGVERSASVLACLPQEISLCPARAPLSDIDSGQPSPTGSYRWMDVADQLYSTTYRGGYDYTQAEVELQFFPLDSDFRGYLVATNLKPHFAYQVKLVGIPGTPSNESIGLTGRWWQEEWNGSAWANGQNLNDKGDGSSPSPNDDVYFSRRDLPDSTSPTGRKYRYTGYLLLDYLVTDETGGALLAIRQNSSYHVLWKTVQRSRTTEDGPPMTTTFDVALPDPVSAYDQDYAAASVTVFGEWERLPVGGVRLPTGVYDAELILTEESFHGSGLAGGWAAAMGVPVLFEIERPL